MLHFNNQWRYYPPGTINIKIVNDIFDNVIAPIRTNGVKQDIYEIFKRHFGGPSGRSSDEGWAQSDLFDAMRKCAEKNAALFAEALYDGLMEIESKGKSSPIPPWPFINSFLAPCGLVILPPDLITTDNYVPIAVPDVNPSLDKQATALIQRSLQESEAYLTSGSHRAAVQEILWLLETITSAFRGVKVSEEGNIQGKYFSKIIGDLRRLHQGKTLERVMTWLDNMYGFLSAPEGGGVRHGSTLDGHAKLTQNEARLFCDLTRSYITYLLNEHARLVAEPSRERRRRIER